MKPSVYLAGTVTPDPENLSWREAAKGYFLGKGWEPINPVRFQLPMHWDKLGLNDCKVPAGFLVDVDLADVRRCTAMMLVVWKNCPRQSIGTWYEFAAAVNAGKPVVVVTDDPTISQHPFIQRKASIIVDSVEEGMEWVVRCGNA